MKGFEPMSQDTNSKIFKYNDVEIEFDLSDADILEKYENIFDEMGEKEKKLPKTGKQSEIIRAQYNWFVEVFDKLLGEGIGKKVCGEKCSVANCYDAYEYFLSFVANQKLALTNRALSISNSYSNRAQRRASAKSKKKNG